MATDTIASTAGTAQPRARDAAARAAGRLLYIDNMRTMLIVLVIVGHMAITYGAPLGEWYYHEAGTVSTVFAILTTLLLGIGASFLLGLFYLISGYFTPGPYDRKGPGAFLADRLKRLGLPLLVYAVVINPVVKYMEARHGGFQGSIAQYVAARLPDLTTASISVLWFVELLLAFSLVYALLRLLGIGAPLPTDRSPAPVPSNRSIAGFALVLALATFVVRLWAPFGWWWEPLHQEPGHWPQYIAFFAAGVLAYRHDWLARLSSRQVRPWRWAALALIPGFPALAVAAGALSGEMDPAVLGGLTWLSAAYSLWEAFIGTALVITVLVWCRDRTNRQGRLLRAMAPASYAVYVLHPPLIVALALALSSIPLELGVKFVLVTPLAVALCFLVGILIRRLPLVRNVL